MPKNDLASLLKAFDAIPKAARKSISKSIDKGADELVNRMQYLAPEKSGRLKRSIRKTPLAGDLGTRVEAGGSETTKPVRNAEKGNAPEFDYALASEYGTSEMPAQPFFWPAVNTLKKRVRRRVDSAISKTVKDVWGKK